MNGDDPHTNERQSLQTRLLDAVKQCQVRFGGRTELATDSDSRVSCLCSAWETVLQHGLRGGAKALTALKQVTEITGLNKVTGMFDKTSEKESAYWNYVKEILTKHEAERFHNLKHINTDSGRGRAWLRAALNEHALERYMHMLVESDILLGQQYENWAFLRDEEKSSMLPMMARGLDSILFAINVDNAELNAVRQVPGTVVNVTAVQALPAKSDGEVRPVIAGDNVIEKKKEKKKKKKVAHIVDFDTDDSGHFSKLSESDIKNGFSTNSSLSSLSPEQTVLRKSPVTPEYNFRTLSQSMLNSQSDSELVRAMPREPSIASGMSDSQKSHGSFSSADFELSIELGTNMEPVDPNGTQILNDSSYGTGDEVAHSYDSSGMSQFSSEDIQSATYALKHMQIAFDNSQRTQGDGGNVSEEIRSDRMSTEELKKAVVTMMLRKDEVEELNRTLNQNLEQEMAISSVLRTDIEQMKHSANVKLEKEQAKLLSLQKENELLKHQLRKYVNAVQMLRTEGSQVDVNLGIHVEEPQPSIPPEKPLTDYSHEAHEYEKKLIQVAEMHGELMEFNELLHRTLNFKENLLKRLQSELVDLRGPLPHDLSFADDHLIAGMESQLIRSSTLINVWIPSAFLRGSSSDKHHVYQVYVRIRDEEWNVYKRYKQFAELHHQMRKKYEQTLKFDFPQKKTFGKKDAKVVESRRRILQTYLRCIINYILENNDTLAKNVCKQNLLEFMPFFSDKPSEKEKKKSDGHRTPRPSSPQQATPLPAQYSGL